MDIDFEAVAVVVNNPTASPVFIRIGAPDTPTETNADLFVPSGQNISHPASGYSFAATFGQATALASAAAALSGLFTTCIITFLGAGETIPSYGSASFLTLSISELRPITAYAGVTVSPTFDIGAWGGALIYVNPDAASGQAVIAVEVSTNGMTFSPLGTYAIWPNVPSIITVPRVARYFRLTLNATAIPGEPGIVGSYSVRASLEEVQTLTYNPTGNTITKAYNIAPLGSQQWLFVVVGLPAVSIAAIATVGTGAASSITFLVEASSDLVNWRQVTARTQRMSSGITLYRALGNLDIFIRVAIFEIGNNAQVGSLYVSSPSEPDLGYILNTIQQSIGDNSAPTNTNQDVYHELDTIRTNIAATNTALGTVIADLVTINTSLGTLHTDLVGIDAKSQTQINFLSTINTTTQTMSATETSMDSRLTTINTAVQSSDAKLTTINTNITTVNTNLGTINTNILATNTAIATETVAVVALAAPFTRGALLSTFGAFVPGAAGIFVNTAVGLVPGAYITSAQVGMACAAATANSLVQLAWGTGAGAVFIFYQTYVRLGAVGGGVFMGSGDTVQYWSTRSAGLQIPAGNNALWAATNAPVGAAMSGHVVSAP